jgi:hypothetical protein
MAQKKYIIIGEDKRNKTVVYTFFGILIFVAVFFPLFELNFRYQLGQFFSKIFDIIGTISLTIGSAIVVITILTLFAGGKVFLRTLIVGIVLVWIGCWCTGAVVNLFGVSIGNSDTSGGAGYH